MTQHSTKKRLGPTWGTASWLFALVNLLMPIGTTFGDLVARDDFDQPVRRLSFEQTPALGTFTSIDDGFQVYQAGVGRIPPQFLDLSSSTNDTLGIVSPDTKTDRWFGISDTKNPDNASGETRLTWQFDVSGYSSLSMQVRIGGMGDFEQDDLFDWTYSWDGTNYLDLLISAVDLAGSHEYVLSGGTRVPLDDPLKYGSNVVTNLLTDFTAPISGTGAQLWIRLRAVADGGTEAFVFDDLRIEGAPDQTAGPACDTNQDNSVDGVDLGVVFSHWGNGGAGDITQDGLADGADAAVCFSEWTGDGLSTSVTSVPEPHHSAWGVLLGWMVRRSWKR